MNFEEWKKECALYAERIGVAGPDIWAEDDPYDLADAPLDAFNDDLSPKEFIDEVFAEDIASREHDDIMDEDALDHELDFDDDQETEEDHG